MRTFIAAISVAGFALTLQACSGREEANVTNAADAAAADAANAANDAAAAAETANAAAADANAAADNAVDMGSTDH